MELYVAIVGYESILGIFDSLEGSCDAIRRFQNDWHDVTDSYSNDEIKCSNAYSGCWVDSYILNKTSGIYDKSFYDSLYLENE